MVRPVGDDLQGQSVEQRQDPPRRAPWVLAREGAGRHPAPDRPLEETLPLEVQSAGRPSDRGTSSRLGPGVEPELERPVLVGGGIGPEEDAQRLDRRTSRGHRDRGHLEVLPRHDVERRRQHVVHRAEVVMDEARRRAHLRGHVTDRRRGEALAPRDVDRRGDDRLAPFRRRHPFHRPQRRTILRKRPIAAKVAGMTRGDRRGDTR